MTAPPPPFLRERSFAKSLKAVAAGINPMELKRGIDQAMTAELKKISKPVNDPKSIAQVASTGPVHQ